MNNMMLISTGTKEGDKTFKMIPLAEECPYVEGIFYPGNNILALIGVNKKDIFHMMPKLDANGDPEFRKTPSKDGIPVKQERRTIETYQEYYLEERADIDAFIKYFAINADTFDYGKFFREPAAE
jgi:hypothetical protein